MISIRLLNESKLTRDQLIKNLKSDGIDTRPTFPVVSQYPIWPNKNFVTSQNSNIIAKTGLNLPSALSLRKEEVDYICQRIIYYLE